MRKSAWLPLGVVAAVSSVILSGCGSSSTPTVAASTGGSGAAAPAGNSSLQPGFFGSTDAGGTPTQGGTLTFGYTGSISSFDPSTQQYSGTSGGDEALAVYGSLATYNTNTQKYEPSMAKSITSNSKFDVWTIGLRDGVKFSDGTPYDADAVKFNLDRLAASQQGWSQLWDSMVKSVTVKNPTTVQITLTQPWADFQFLLSQAPGEIASPAAVKKEGDNYLKQPVGAGPFVFKSWQPSQELDLTANPNYWDGKPYLDGLKFVTINGDQAVSDSLNNGEIQASFLDTPDIIAKDVASGKFSGNTRFTNTGTMLLINNGTPAVPDAPGKDLNVRKAIAESINTDVINQRAFNGEGFPGTAVFQSTSAWSSGSQGTPYNLDAAKADLATAKSSGYDGKISLLYLSTQQQSALTIQAELQAAGFTVTTQPVQGVMDLVNHVLIKSDYQLALYGWPVPDEPGELYTSYMQRFGAQPNQLGYYNATINSALKDFASTNDEAQKKQDMATLEQQWDQTIPSVSLSAAAETVAWANNVHGITVSSRDNLDFSKAWIGN